MTTNKKINKFNWKHSNKAMEKEKKKFVVFSQLSFLSNSIRVAVAFFFYLFSTYAASA